MRSAPRPHPESCRLPSGGARAAPQARERFERQTGKEGPEPANADRVRSAVATHTLSHKHATRQLTSLACSCIEDHRTTAPTVLLATQASAIQQS